MFATANTSTSGRRRSDADTDADADADADADTDADADPPRCRSDDECPAPPPGRCVEALLLRPALPASCVEGECSYAEEVIDCAAAGCCTDRCCSFVPANQTDFGDFDRAAAEVTVIAGSSFDTTSDCFGDTILGTCEVLAPAASPQACVCRTGALTIEALTVSGARVLVVD